MQGTKDVTQTLCNNPIQGTVKWFNTEKGYGFISDADGTDYFAHYSQIQMNGFKQLTQGDIVSFSVQESEKGVKAVDIVPLLMEKK